jgi:hypothetical protein
MKAGEQTIDDIFFQNAINHAAKSGPVLGRCTVRHSKAKIFFLNKDLSRYL